MAHKKEISKYNIEQKSRSVSEEDKQPFFDYGEIAKKLWSEKIKEGHDAFNIRFDHENDDSMKKRRIITLEIPDENNIRTGKDKYQFKCDMHRAGGDWQEPCCYFRCQIVDGSFYEMTRYPGDIGMFGNSCFTVMPGPEEGNTPLEKGKKGGWVAMDSVAGTKEEHPEIDEKKAWDFLVRYLTDLLVEYLKKKELTRMLTEKEDKKMEKDTEEDTEKKVAALDKIADALEAQGFLKEAAEVDVISNTLEKLAVYDVMHGTPATRQLKGRATALQDAVNTLKKLPPTRVQDVLVKQFGDKLGNYLLGIAMKVDSGELSFGEGEGLWMKARERAKLQPTRQPGTDVFLPGGPVKPKPAPREESPFLNPPGSQIKLVPMGRCATLLKEISKTIKDEKLEKCNMSKVAEKLRALCDSVERYYQLRRET